MKIDKHTTIANIPIKSIRDFFRRYRTPAEFSIATVQQYFKISVSSAKCLCDDLISQGFIANKTSDKYGVTIRGNALAQIKFVIRLNKEKADMLFRKFMDRVEEINSDSTFLYSVKQLFVFGSYLDCNANDFGDIDIAFILEPKIKDDQKFMDAQNKLVREACDNGKVFSSFTEELFYAETIVLRYLKNRSPYISLHRMRDLIELRAPYKQIYP